MDYFVLLCVYLSVFKETLGHVCKVHLVVTTKVERTSGISWVETKDVTKHQASLEWLHNKELSRFKYH